MTEPSPPSRPPSEAPDTADVDPGEGAARPRRRRWPLRLAALLLLLALALGGLAWFALGTEAGARWLFTRLGAIMPGELEVADLDGPIRGPLTVHGLRYASESMEVTIERLFLDWRLRELLAKRLDIHRLEAEGVDVLTLPGPEEPERGPLPDINLRFNVIVRDARVRDIEIRSAEEARRAGVDPTEAGAADRAARRDEGDVPDPAGPIRPAESIDPFVIDSIDLATTARGGLVEVDRLAVRAPDFTLDAAGSLRPQGAYDVDLETRWSYRGDEEAGLPAFSGGGTLDGTLERLRVRQALTEPFALRLDARLRDPLYEPEFEAEIEAEGVSTGLFAPDAPAVTADARLAAAGTTEAIELRGTVDADSAEYGRLRAELDVGIDLSSPETRRIAIRELTATRPAPGGRAPMRLSARGNVIVPAAVEEGAAAAPIRFDLGASWRDVAWPLDGEPTVSSARGEATVVGSVDDYRLAAEAAVAAGALENLGPLGTWTLEGRGDARSFELATLSGDLLRGSFTGSGRVAWDPRVEWRLDLAGRGVDPSVLAADYPGSLAFRASTRGHLPEAEGAGPVGRVELASLEGTLREQPISAEGRLELAGDRYRLDPLRVTWAADTLEASGTLGEVWDLSVHLDAPNLAVALDGVSGTLVADATIAGPAEALRVGLTARGDSLAYGDLRAGGVDVAAAVDLGPEGPIDLDLTATGVDLGTVQADRMVVAGEGTRGAHVATLDLFPRADGPAAARLALAGGLDPSPATAADADTAPLAWRGRITRLDVDADRLGELGLGGAADGPPRLGTWRLTAPAELAASSERAALEGFCWAGEGRICAEGEWRAEAGWSARAELSAVPLALAEGFLPPDVEVTGDLDGTLSAEAGADGRLAGSARLLPGPGLLVYPAASEREQRLRYEQGLITAVADADGVSADLALVLVDVGRIDGQVELPGYGTPGAAGGSQPVRGRLSAELADLGFLQAFLDGVREVGGRLDVDLTVGGTLEAPEVRGEAVLAGARADLPEYGLELRDLALTARGVGREPIALDGSVRSGGGTLTLAGSVPLAPSPETPARLRVEGRDFEVVDTEEIRALASPDLTLAYDGAIARVTGEVRVPEARVEIDERGESGAVTASRDVVFVGPDGAVEQADAGPAIEALEARVRVILGDDVEVDVLGLYAEPTGSLLLVEEPGRPTSATGQLDLNQGTFSAYGQDLTLERGRLIFAGPVTEPAIDLRAYRRADDGVVAGLEATGTLSRPVVTLWSEPPMAESDQLSYVLLGKPLDQVGQGDGSEGSLLANAATALGIKGGNLLGERLAARFGLEEARIEADGGYESASLVLGKYLSPRLFVGYGIGLFEAVNTFRIRYLLNDKLTLEGETGAGTSADLLYTLERGEGAKRRVPDASPEEILDERPEAPAEAEPNGDGRR